MKGIIAAGHRLTAEAGIEIFDSGGNAFDAAVAASFAAFVCESPLTSMGGGGFFMAHEAAGETLLYDFFPNVPGLGKRGEGDKFDFYPVQVDFTGTLQEFHIGKGAAAVPGCMAGFSAVFRRHCTLPLKILLAPAIRYAREGVLLSEEQACFHCLLTPIFTASEEGKMVYAPKEKLLEEGDRLVSSALADTLVHLSEAGLEEFYRGEIAKSIVNGFSDGGLITAEDLRAYKVEVRRPLVISYRGRRIYTNPPPSSSGGCLVAFSLKLLEKHDLKALRLNGAEYLKLLCDLMRITDEARGEDFDHRIYEPDIAETFLDEARIALYREKLKKGILKNGGEGVSSSGNTTHISVVDDAGNAVSVTTSNGEGCGWMIPNTGIMVNNMLGEEDINPHGFHRQPPGTRMSSMMAPTIVMEKGRPVAVLGSGGSNRIRNAILQVIVNLVDFGLPVHEAVNAPRAHWDRKCFQVEEGNGDGVIEMLFNEGIPCNGWNVKNLYFGGVHTVVAGDGDNSFDGAGDVRRGGVCLKTTGEVKNA